MNHNNIYNILNKLSSLEAKAEPKAQVIKEDSMLNGLSSETGAIANRLNESYLAEKDMGKHNNATTGFKALAKKAGGGEKGEKIAGAQFQKMKKAGQLEEDQVDEHFAFTDPKKGGKGNPSQDKLAQRGGKSTPAGDPRGYKDMVKGEGPFGKKAKDMYGVNGPKGKLPEGEYDDSPNKDKIPAFQRKAKAAPGDNSWKVSQQDLEANKLKNISSRESLAQRSGRPMPPVEEADANPHSAYAPLPGMRPTGEDEQSEYRHAAQVLRKWMRKRGHNPHHDFKKSLSYIGDNLDECHDDTLTPDIFDAYHTIQKHRSVHGLSEGKQTKADKDYDGDGEVESGKEEYKGSVDKAIKKAKGEKVTEGEKVPTKTGMIHKGTYGNSYEEEGDDDFDEHGNKKTKKAGRPEKKDKKPERVTSKAWKHKGERKVKESINLETYVDDTIAELNQIFFEGSKKKPDFLDVDKDGDKKESFKKAVKDKEKVKEGINESSELRHHPIYTTQEAWDHYAKELEEEKLGKIAAGDDLTDLARLAGVNTTPVTHSHELGCNMSASGQHCPVHGIAECGGMMYESDEKADKDYDGDGEVETGAEEHAGSVDKAIKKAMGKKDKEDVEESLDDILALAGRSKGLPPTMGSTEIIAFEPEDEMGMGDEEVCPACGASPCACDHEHEEGGATHLFGEEYANEPHEEFGSVDAQLGQGNDLNKRKQMYKHNYKGGDNPMGTSDNFMEDSVEQLTRMLNAMKK